MLELYALIEIIGAIFYANIFVQNILISFHVTDERHQKDT